MFFFWWWATEWVRLTLRHRRMNREYYARIQHQSDQYTRALSVITGMTGAAAAALARRDYAAHSRLTAEIARIRDQMQGGTPR